MRGAVLYGPGDVRLDERDEPRIEAPGDAIMRLGRQLRVRLGPVALPRDHPGGDWPYPIGHEYCGVVEEVGGDVRTVEPGQFVIGSFVASDSTCPNCQAYQTTCLHRQPPPGWAPGGSSR